MEASGNIWEYFQTEKSSVFESSLARTKFLVSLFRAKARVLNIGTGSGKFEELGLAGGLDIYALDPGEKSIGSLRQKLGLAEKAAVGEAQAIPFADEFFDAVVMSEVLEHLEPEVMARSLPEVKRVLKKGGLFVGTVPCSEKLEEELVVCPTCGDKFHKWGHKQSFTADSLAGKLSEYFQPVELSLKLFVPWNVLNWKGKFIYIAKVLMFKAGILGEKNLNIFFVCAKQ